MSKLPFVVLKAKQRTKSVNRGYMALEREKFEQAQKNPKSKYKDLYTVLDEVKDAEEIAHFVQTHKIPLRRLGYNVTLEVNKPEAKKESKPEVKPEKKEAPKKEQKESEAKTKN